MQNVNENPNLQNINASDLSSQQQVSEDSPDDVNFIISNLGTPADNVPTYVSRYYNNESIVGNEIQAYAKIAGCNWTYYVKELTVTIGRNTEQHSNPNIPTTAERINIDLGPSKVVSRKHATIVYNLNERKWQLFINGRNGLKVNGVRLNLSPNTPFDLSSGNILDIGGTQMMFILPDAPPVIPDYFRYLLSNKKAKLNNSMNQKYSSTGNQLDSILRTDVVNNTQIKAFQLQEGISALHPHSFSSEQDYSKDDAKDLKPPYSYATMITQAILSNPQGILSLAEIYDWISSHFAYYRYTKQGWQNSIRHNLSLNKAFEKVPRKPNEPGKGMKWQISESYRNEFLKKWEDGSLNKIRRGTSVSRQLQLHLIKNNALPKGRENLSHENNDFKDDTNNDDNTHDNKHPIHNNPNLSNPLYKIPNMSPNKDMQNDITFLQMKNGQNSAITSPIKTMSIPEINYLNNDPKLSSGLVSGLNNNNISDQLLQNMSAGDTKNSNSHLPGVNKLNDDGLVRSYPIPSIRNQQSEENTLTSPKKMFHRLDLMTPERNIHRPNLESTSVNSSPALWNYVQFSTPLGPNNGNQNGNQNGNNINTVQGDNEKLPRIELESPLKNRRTFAKIADPKDGFK
jgi:hypothetical protein